MAHLLCITSGLTGILYASIAMCKRLEAAGHRVTYACPHQVRAQVEANDISYVQLAAQPLSFQVNIPKRYRSNKWSKWWYRFSRRAVLQDTAIEQLKMKAFEDVLADLSPDLVIVDLELHAHIMTMFSIKQPFILLSQWFSLWNRKGLPPLSHNTIPDLGWAGSQLGLSWAWWKIKYTRQWNFFKRGIFSLGLNRRSVLMQYAQQIGFPLKYIKDNYWPGPFTYSNLPVISINLEALEFPHDKRPNLYYVGAMIDASRMDAEIDEATREQLKHIFRLKQARSAKLIYCSVSSMKKGDQKFLNQVVDAVREHENWLLIISLGGKIKNQSLRNLPPNVFAFAWSPQMKILAYADCSINHGGIHTINECIYFRVPMLVYSGKRADQNGCAARIHYHQLGIMADKDTDSPSDITNKIEQVLNDPIYKSKLRAMNLVYQQYVADQRLEEVVLAALAK